MNHRHALSLGFAAVLAAGCADYETTGTELSAVCVRDLPVVFGAGDASASAPLDVDELGVSASRLVGARVVLDDARLLAGAGIDDFGFASGVRIDVSARGMSPALVADQAPLPAIAALEVDGDPAVDLTGHLAEGQIMLSLRFTGTMPRGRWELAMDACFDVDGVEL